jgi:integrase
MLIKVLAATWLDRLKTRKRKPCKPATIKNFSSGIRNHVNPLIGEMEVETFQNKQLKDFAEALVAKGLAPKTCHETIGMVQQIIRSALDENGNALYLRNWNRGLILENVADVRDQHQPICTKEMIKEAMRVRHAATDKYRTIIALLLASGIRIGELVALRVGDDGEHSGWDEQNSLLAIQTSLWNGVEQKPKTQSSIRLVNLSVPVNAMLAAYAKALNKNPGDYLFSTKRGTPLRPSSLCTYALAPLGIPGFHSARRWRVSYLKTIGTPESLLKFWLGHSNGDDTTARYDKSCDDHEWRQSWANRCGIGFELPELCQSGHPAPRGIKSAITHKTTPEPPDV